MRKLIFHHWYLKEELVPLSFFDPIVASTTKSLMAKALSEQSGTEHPSKRVTIAVEDIQGQCQEDFVTKGILAFFKKMSLPIGYLYEPPDSWNSTHDNVTNDNAERDVTLIQEYNRLFTQDADQLQYILM